MNHFNFVRLYPLFAGILALLLAYVWKFHIEELVDPFLPGIHAEESPSERWEFVIALTLMVMLALVLPAIAGRKFIKRLTVFEEMAGLSTLAFMSSCDAILIANDKREIVAANPAFARLTGYNAAEVYGKKPSAFAPPGHDVIWEMEQHLAEFDRWRGDFAMLGKNGRSLEFSLSISVTRDENGNVERYVAILTPQWQENVSAPLAVTDRLPDGSHGPE